jgi:hypothetical protein
LRLRRRFHRRPHGLPDDRRPPEHQTASPLPSRLERRAPIRGVVRPNAPSTGQLLGMAGSSLERRKLLPLLFTDASIYPSRKDLT